MLPPWFLLCLACNDAVLFKIWGGRNWWWWGWWGCDSMCEIRIMLWLVFTVHTLYYNYSSVLSHRCDPVTERHHCHVDEVISFTGIKTKLHKCYQKKGKKVFLFFTKVLRAQLRQACQRQLSLRVCRCCSVVAHRIVCSGVDVWLFFILVCLHH